MHQPDTDVDKMWSDPEIETIVAAQKALTRGGPGASRFPTTLELAFNGYHSVNTLKRLRLALLAGLLLYLALGLVDSLLPPADRSSMWSIRYGLICPALAAGLACSYLSRLRRVLQPVVSLALLLASLGTVAMVYLDPAPAKNLYFPGILLLTLGAFAVASLRFGYAISWALVTTLAYEAVAILPMHADASALLQNNLSLFATLLAACCANYLMEKHLRRDFLNSLLLEHDHRRLQKAEEQLHRLSISDALTGLANRRHFEYTLDQEWMRGMRSVTPISLVLFDIDFFNDYNDNYGHRAGDECLRLVAEKIGSFAKRAGDTSARYGGEEFALLLPGADRAQAANIAERCRSCVESLQISHSHSQVSQVVTVSAGIATMTPDKFAGTRELLEAADRALYRAKREGRNQVASGKSGGAQNIAEPRRQENLNPEQPAPALQG